MRRQEIAETAAAGDRLAREGYWRGTVIGSAQILALLAGMSRDGVVMATGMFRAARPCSPACSPVSAATCQSASWSAGCARTLTSFAVYCLALGLDSIVYLELLK